MKKYLFIFILFYFTGNAQQWVWAKNFGGGHIGYDLAGNFYDADGFNTPSITIGTITLYNNNAPNPDVCFIKYDSLGNVKWAVSGDGKGYDAVSDISVENNGSAYITGYFEDTISFGSTALFSHGSSDIFILKIDSNGNLIWARSFGGAADDSGVTLETDASGNIFLSGQFSSSSIVFGTDTLFNPAPNFPDIFIVKCNSNGTSLWARSAGGTKADYPTTITTDSQGNCIVAGGFVSTTISFQGVVLVNAAIDNFSNLFIAKYSPAGNLLWAKSAGEDSTTCPITIKADGVGNIVCTGYFYSSSVTFGSFTLNNLGYNDVFIAKYDMNGNIVWAQRAGSNGNDKGTSLDIDAFGNIFLAGTYSSSSINFASYTLNNVNAGSSDIFIVKYSGAGNVICAEKATGYYDNGVNSVHLDIQNNLYVAGYSLGPSITFGSIILSNSNTGSFVAKLVDFPTAIRSQYINNLSIEIYPNPSNGRITIKTNEINPHLHLKVYSILGQCIVSKIIENDKTEILMTSGIYFAYFENGIDATVKKIIVK